MDETFVWGTLVVSGRFKAFKALVRSFRSYEEPSLFPESSTSRNGETFLVSGSRIACTSLSLPQDLACDRKRLSQGSPTTIEGRVFKKLLSLVLRSIAKQSTACNRRSTACNRRSTACNRR